MKRGSTRLACALALATLCARGPARGADRPATRTDDALGLAVRCGRVRVVHSDDPERRDGSLRLQQADSWRAYALGREVFRREWREQDGVLAALANRPIAGSTNSCAMCHNLPFGTPGSGGNVGEPVTTGRNVPALFGLGIIEMLGRQVSAEILAANDLDRNGRIDAPAETKGRRAVVEAVPGVDVDFGPLEDLNGDGYPGLNDAIVLFLVGRDGRVIRDVDGRPPRPDAAEVAGYVPILAPFSASVGDHHFPTLRLFAAGAFQTILGFRVLDPVLRRPSGDAALWAGTSNAGVRQPYVPEVAATLGASGGLTPGELDMLEWFLLNHPAPASTADAPTSRRGRLLMQRLGCADCHVADWWIKPRDDGRGLEGDRRFFDLEVAADGAGRLRGTVRVLADGRVGADGALRWEPRRGGFLVKGIHTDLRHHDLGERFHEFTVSDGALWMTQRFRTPPLWGVGSTAPYGHDGASPTLDAVIRRHGGEAEESARRYRQATRSDREAVLAYLASLVLYQTDLLPTDLDGNGTVSTLWRDGRDLGPETFRPELLAAVPPVHAGWSRSEDGTPSYSYRLLNPDELCGPAAGATAADGAPPTLDIPEPPSKHEKE